jgi:hypothetical protein
MGKKTVFTQDDFNSNDGMLTSVWGPALWHSLHTISFNYPVNPTEKHKKDYYNFFKSLQDILPCKYCRDNYTKNLEKLPLTIQVLQNRENFSKWLYDMHELINTNLNKKSGLTYDDVRYRYEHFRSRCLTDPKMYKEEKNNKKEKGCTEPLYGVKSKCVLNIVPKDSKIKTFKMNKECKIKKFK